MALRTSIQHPDPLYEAYEHVAPRVEGRPALVEQVAEIVKIDYDWSAEIPALSMP